MSTTVETEKYAGYEALCPWHHRQPFDGVEQYPRVITRADAKYWLGAGRQRRAAVLDVRRARSG